MPLYFFSIRNGRYSGASGRGFDLTDKNAAWAEMTSVCGDLVGSISRNLKQNAEWQMELLDESKKPFIQNPPCRADARLKADSVLASLFDNFSFRSQVKEFLQKSIGRHHPKPPIRKTTRLHGLTDQSHFRLHQRHLAHIVVTN